MEERGKERNNT